MTEASPTEENNVTTETTGNVSNIESNHTSHSISTNASSPTSTPSISDSLTGLLSIQRELNIQRLESMGYTDTNLNTLALESTGNNLDSAIQWIESLR